MVYESISHGPKAVTPSVNTTMRWFSRPKFRVSGVKDTNGKGKFKRMFSFLFVDKESFWLRNRLLKNSTMFSSWRSTKCPVLKFIHGSKVLEDFSSTFFTLLSRKLRF